MENVQLYKSASDMQRRDAEEVLMEFCDKLKWTDGARILDIGCGTGEVTSAILLPQLHRGFTELIGLDVSPEMIQYARKVCNHPKVSFVQFDIAHEAENILEELDTKLKAAENNNGVDKVRTANGSVKILVNDAEDIPVAEANFRISPGYDIISSFYCLHWIHNQRLALTNIHKLLKPGGEALLVLLAKSPIFSLYDQLSKSPLWKDYMQDVENFISPYHRSDNPLRDFTDIVTEVGFVAVKSECRKRSYVYPSTSSLINAIIAVNPFTSRIPNHLQGQFISECMKQVEKLKLTELRNNCHRVTYELLVAHVHRSN